MTWYLGGDQSESLAGGALFDLSLVGLGTEGVFPDLGWQVEATGDFDGDGDGDLVWRHQVSGRVAIWLMEASKLEGGYVLAGVADTNWQILGSGDFNGDRQADLAWQQRATGDMYLWSLEQGQIITGGALGQVDTTTWRNLL